MTPYEQAKQAGYSDQQIIQFLQYKFKDNWKEKAKQYGIPGFNNSSSTNTSSPSDLGNQLPDRQEPEVSSFNNANIQHFDTSDIDASTNNLDVKATATPAQIEASHQADIDNKEFPHKAFDAFQTGDAQAFAGAGRTILDLLNAAGIDIPKANKYLDSVIGELHKEAQQQDKEGYGGFNLAGNIAPSLLLPGAAFKTLPRAAAIGAADAYATARGNGEDKTTSLAAGASGGLVGGLAFKVIDKLQGKDVDRLYKWLKERYNLNDKEVDTAYKNYLSTMKSSGNVKKDKIKAIVFSLGDHGRTLVNEAVKEEGQPVANAVMREMKARTDEMDNRVAPATDVKDIVSTASNKASEVKQNYSNFVNKVGHVSGKPVKVELPDALDEVSQSINGAIKQKVVNNPVPTISDLIDAQQLASKGARNTRDTQKAMRYKQIANSLEDELKNRLTPEHYKEWKQVKTDYAKMSSIYNKFGPDIEAVNRGEMSPDILVKKIANSKEALNSNTFKNIEFLIGKDKMPEFEKAIVKNYYSPDGINKATWNYVYGRIKDKGFITPEGKQLQQDFNRLAYTFKVDDLLKSLTGKARKESVGWSDDLISKAKFSIVNKIWNWIVKKLPTENSRYMRKMDTLADVLKKESVPLPRLINEGIKSAFNKEDYEKLLSNKKNRMNFFKNFNLRFQQLPAKVQKKALPVAKAFKKALASGDFDAAARLHKQLKAIAGKDFEVIKPTDVYEPMRKGSISIGKSKLDKTSQGYLDLLKLVDEDSHNKLVNAMKEMDKKSVDYSSLDDVKNYVEKASTTTKSLKASPAQVAAIKEYVVGDYTGINTTLRESLKNTPATPYVKELLKFFRQPGNYRGIAYRGTLIPKEKLNALKPGDVVLNRAILSTAKNEGVAETYLDMSREMAQEGDIPVHIKFDIEQPQYDITKINNAYEESEVLIKPGSFLKLVKKKVHPDYIEYEFKVIPKSKVGKAKIRKDIMSVFPGIGIPLSQAHKSNNKGDNNVSTKTLQTR